MAKLINQGRKIQRQLPSNLKSSEMSVCFLGKITISLKLDFDISCKLSPAYETICMKCQSQFSEMAKSIFLEK